MANSPSFTSRWAQKYPLATANSVSALVDGKALLSHDCLKTYIRIYAIPLLREVSDGASINLLFYSVTAVTLFDSQRRSRGRLWGVLESFWLAHLKRH